MYKEPQSFSNLVNDLLATMPTGTSKGQARLVTQVEIILSLAVNIGLEIEPITVGWVLLSRMPLYHPLLQQLTLEQQRMLANAAVIVPLSSRFGWENALSRYAREIPSTIRLYNIEQNKRLDEQMIFECRINPCLDPQREERYTAILGDKLDFEQKKRHTVEVDKTYDVRVRVSNDEFRQGQIFITNQMQSNRPSNSWLGSPRSRKVISLHIKDLLPTARYLDDRERALDGRVHWEYDLTQIRYQRTTNNSTRIKLEPENMHPLHLEGAVHLPGMVSAGKTTLAKLIIAHSIRMGWDARITLVVGDSHSATEIAHQINTWFCDDPAGDEVVAVPLLGQTQRETHLGRLLASREYTRSLERGQSHWGERWLMPTCPLASQIKWEGGENVSIPAGNEPCEGLMSRPSVGHGRSKRHVCPLFHICPSKQVFRDMPQAKVWVTTPGALSQAAIPLHLENRVVKIGDLVYEQSDLVILDEVETVVEWFDRTFAQQESLTNGKNGLLDRLDTQIAQYWRANRVLPADHRRWIISARESIKALSGVLTAIADPKQERVVKTWVKRGYFTPIQLAYRFARRLAGLKESDGVTISPTERAANDKLTQPIFEPFSQLFNRTGDVLRYQLPGQPTELDQVVYELATLMKTVNNLADDVNETDILLPCRDWILHRHPNVESRLRTLESALIKSQDNYDKTYLEMHIDRSVDELAQRLQFLLTVALLDRHIHIFTEEWHNKPEALDAQKPFSKMPPGMKDILPLPLTGQQYGFVNDTAGLEHSPDAANRLSLFTYANIGRCYLLNFTHLRQAFEGRPGPHILALSGTSYLPDSTAFHVTLPPTGVLVAPKRTEQAIRDSRFIWKYFLDDDDRPIMVSGMPDKGQQLRLLMAAMLKYSGIPGGFFSQQLALLEQQGLEKPDQWADRSRILLLTNSYSQARAAAQILRDRWHTQTQSIYDLKRGKGNEDYEIEAQEQTGALHRIDIEQFASTGGRILIAPMQSIGRGFNILNANSKAAFGTVCFLTRPMSQPHDMVANAQELNRYALEWAADPTFKAWAADTLYQRAINARESAVELRRFIEQRNGYGQLYDVESLRLFPRRDLAATTAGRIVQAVGRSLRGGVPFRAFFVDAAWSPELANNGDSESKEDEKTSLLTAMINVLEEYANRDEIGMKLYGGLSEALVTTENRDSN